MPVKQKPVRLRFFNFDYALLERVRSEFSLDPPLALRPILMDGQSAVLMEVRSKTSRKAIVATPGLRCFLKEVPWYCDRPEFLRFSHALQRQLHHAGAPVPDLYRIKSGETWLEYGNLRLTLTPFVRGVRYQFSAGHAKAAGSSLRSVHSLQDTAALPPYDGDDFLQLAPDHVDLVATERPDVADALPPDALRELRSLAGEFSSILIAMSFHDLPRIGVHGDFNPWNISFDKGGADAAVVGIFDFDNADLHSRLHDLAEALVTFSGAVSYRSSSTRFADVISDVKPDTALAFLSGYDASALTTDELRMLPYTCGLIGIEFSCLGLVRGDFPPGSARKLIQWATSLPAEVARWTGQFQEHSGS